MRRLRLWWHSLTFTGRQNPPRMVEGVMLLLAAILCVAWFFWQKEPLLVLCLSYIVGATASVLTREVITPSTHTWTVRLMVLVLFACLLSSLSFYITRTTHYAGLLPL